MTTKMQRNIYRFFGFGIITFIAFLPFTIEYKKTDAAAPPFAEPSSYYVLPHQSLWLSGKYYTPGEQITVRQSGLFEPIAIFKAGGNGTFQGNITATNAYRLASTTVRYTVIGSQSRYPVQFSVVYGTYHPQIEPATYYAMPGQLLYITGKDFAPNEPVSIIQNNYFSDIMYADKNGNLKGFIRLPPTGKITDLVARGFWSDRVSVRTITLR